MLLVRLCVILNVLLLTNSCTETKTNDSPVILQATRDGSPGTSGFLFRQDGTYEWINGSGLGVGIKQGSYLLKDSIIILDTNTIDKVIKSKYLLIHTQPALWNADTTVTYVFQADSLGNKQDSLAAFLVYMDKRSQK